MAFHSIYMPCCTYLWNQGYDGCMCSVLSKHMQHLKYRDVVTSGTTKARQRCVCFRGIYSISYWWGQGLYRLGTSIEINRMSTRSLLVGMHSHVRYVYVCLLVYKRYTCLQCEHCWRNSQAGVKLAGKYACSDKLRYLDKKNEHINQSLTPPPSHLKA